MSRSDQIRENRPYVIVGNGVAAAGCIEGIRSVDPHTPIVILSQEPYPVYCRPLISYYLQGKTPKERMAYRGEDFYEKNQCQVRYGAVACRLDIEKREILLEDGSAQPYSQVCIATGSTPFVPPIAGLEQVQNRFSFFTWDDALGLEQAITPQSRVLILGAGLIGLKCAEGLWSKVAQITVCDLAPRILSSILDEECARVMQDCLEEHGIRFYLSDTVEEFQGNQARMRSGEQVPFDILVTAIGVRPRTQLVQQAGGETDRGILVDLQMRTSLPGVYSAGDCTQGYEVVSGERKVLALWPNAYCQGHCAGVNMAGGEERFDKGIPMNSIGFFQVHAMTAGSCQEEGAQVYRESQGSNRKKLFLKDGVLVGMMLLGDLSRAGIYTSLIREKTPLDSIRFDILKKSPELSAFSLQTRHKILGGVV